MIETVTNPGVKGRARFGLAFEKISEDAVLAKKAEQFARQDSSESDDLPLSQSDPLVVRAGMANQGVGINQSGGMRAEDLDLLAAHHVSLAIRVDGDSRDDGDSARFDPDQMACQIARPGGAGDIRRFDPAAVGADHSSQQHRQVAKPFADHLHRVGEPSGID